MVTWGVSPQQAIALDEEVPDFAAVAGRDPRELHARALAYMDLRPGMRMTGLPVDAAFIGSCTNSSLSDLRRAAAPLRGRKVAPGRTQICGPGPPDGPARAVAEGVDRRVLQPRLLRSTAGRLHRLYR